MLKCKWIRSVNFLSPLCRGMPIGQTQMRTRHLPTSMMILRSWKTSEQLVGFWFCVFSLIWVVLPLGLCSHPFLEIYGRNQKNTFHFRIDLIAMLTESLHKMCWEAKWALIFPLNRCVSNFSYSTIFSYVSSFLLFHRYHRMVCWQQYSHTTSQKVSFSNQSFSHLFFWFHTNALRWGLIDGSVAVYLCYRQAWWLIVYKSTLYYCIINME